MTENKSSKIRIVFYDEGAQGKTQLGGGQLARLDLMQRLDPNHFTPILLTSQDKELADAARERNIQVQVTQILNNNYFRFQREKLFTKPSYLFNTLKQGVQSGKRLALILKHIDADILHPNENLSRTIALFTGLWHKIPSVTHIEGEWNKGLTDAILRNLFYYGFDYLIAVSKRVAEIVDGKGNKTSKISVINEGIDYSRYRDIDKKEIRNDLNISYNSLVIATIGKLIDYKGQHIALQALAECKKENILYNFDYIIVGDGPDKSKLANLAAKLGLKEHVHFLGQRTDVPDTMAGADCILQPSLTEAFPLVQVESLMAGRYVIASDVGGASEILDGGKYGTLIPPGDTNAITNAIKELLEMNPEYKQRIIKEGQKRAIENYSIENAVKKTEQVYYALIEK